MNLKHCIQLFCSLFKNPW